MADGRYYFTLVCDEVPNDVVPLDRAPVCWTSPKP